MERRLIYSDVAHQILRDGGDIEDVPTAENVREAIQGDWVTSHPASPAKNWKCTACQGLITLPVWTDHCYYDFCPNCGANMRSGGIGEYE